MTFEWRVLLTSSVEATDLTTLKPSEAIAVTKVLVSDVGVESTADLQC